MEMLEHVPDPASVVRACATLVKPGGWVFFSTLNRNPKSFLFAIVGRRVPAQPAAARHPRIRQDDPPQRTGALLRAQAGLELRHTRGMEYNPLTRRYWLSANTSVNYLFAMQKPGLRASGMFAAH